MSFRRLCLLADVHLYGIFLLLLDHHPEAITYSFLLSFGYFWLFIDRTQPLSKIVIPSSEIFKRSLGQAQLILVVMLLNFPCISISSATILRSA